MDGKLLIGQHGSAYSFTAGTRVINLSGITVLSGQTEQLLYIYNETQGIVYYGKDSSLKLTTITADNTLTIDSSLPVIAANDRITILIQWQDPSLNASLGLIQVSDITANNPYPPDPPEQWLLNAQPTVAGTYFYLLFYQYPYKYVDWFIRLVDGGNITPVLYASWNPNAVIPATNGTPSNDWVDVTAQVWGTVTPASNILLAVPNKVTMMPALYMVSITTVGTTNTFDIWGRRF